MSAFPQNSEPNQNPMAAYSPLPAASRPAQANPVAKSFTTKSFPAKSVAAKNFTWRRESFIGGMAFLALFGGFGALAHFSEIGGAVVGSGALAVEGYAKKIQHPTGGIVADIYVKNGSKVEAGQKLVRLDDVITKANLSTIIGQLTTLEARRLRLVEEQRGGKQLILPKSYLTSAPEAPSIGEGEVLLLKARYDGREGQKSQLRERIGQTQQEIAGLEAQRNARQQEVKLIMRELTDMETLFTKNLVSLARIMPLRRESARITGEIGNLTANIAKARGNISETEVTLLQIDQTHISEVLKDLRETESRIAELVDKKITAEDSLRKIDIISPVAGEVHELSVHTKGGVIGSGELLMQIMPAQDRLLIDLRISPGEIDQVSQGQKAIVRFPTLNQRTTPELIGEVQQIGSDAQRDKEGGQSYFSVRVVVSETEWQKPGLPRLTPGIPVEVLISTSQRSVLSYLVKPASDQFRRAFTER